MPFDPEKFSTQLIKIKESGHSGRSLAKMAGVTEKTIRNWIACETGPTLVNLYGLADGLDMQVGELLGEVDENRSALKRVEADLDRVHSLLAELKGDLRQG